MLETLSGLQKNGIRICIATGSPPAILPQFPGIEFDAYLTFNASYCYTKNEVIFRNPIPAADVQTVIRNASKIQRPLALAGASRMGANGSDKDLADYFAISRHKLEIIALGMSQSERDPGWAGRYRQLAEQIQKIEEGRE